MLVAAAAGISLTRTAAHCLESANRGLTAPPAGSWPWSVGPARRPDPAGRVDGAPPVDQATRSTAAGWSAPATAAMASSRGVNAFAGTGYSK
jgi:hypothetical protein